MPEIVDRTTRYKSFTFSRPHAKWVVHFPCGVFVLLLAKLVAGGFVLTTIRVILVYMTRYVHHAVIARGVGFYLRRRLDYNQDWAHVFRLFFVLTYDTSLRFVGQQMRRLPSQRVIERPPPFARAWPDVCGCALW